MSTIRSRSVAIAVGLGFCGILRFITFGVLPTPFALLSLTVKSCEPSPQPAETAIIGDSPHPCIEPVCSVRCPNGWFSYLPEPARLQPMIEGLPMTDMQRRHQELLLEWRLEQRVLDPRVARDVGAVYLFPEYCADPFGSGAVPSLYGLALAETPLPSP